MAKKNALTRAKKQQAISLMQQGNTRDAKPLLEKIVRADRQDLEALFMLGIANGIEGNHASAEQTFRQILKFQPKHPDANNNLGLSLESQGRSQDALEFFARAVQLAPDNPGYAFNYANAFESLGQLQSARRWYEKAISLAPDYPDAYCNLGNVLREEGDTLEAIAAHQNAIAISPDFARQYPEIYINLGNAYMDIGQGVAAVEAYQRAVNTRGNPRDYQALGNAYLQTGEHEKAESALRRAIDMAPDFGSAYRNLVQARRFVERDADVVAMEKLYEQDTLEDKNKTELAFALGKAYADIRDDARSFEYYRQGNALKRASIEYTIEQDRQFFSAIKQTISAEFLQQHAGVSCSDDAPIFIIGMPRSGTSLTEQILASHSQVHGAGELNDLRIVIERACETQDEAFPKGLTGLSDQALLDIANSYRQRLRVYAPEAERITDKMPHNFLYLGLIRLLFPKSKIIHCQRNPMDNALSIFKALFNQGHRYAYDLQELGQYYQLYLDLMQHWRTLLPDAFYELSYETLVSDQETQTRQLLEYCELPWEDNCLQFHRTERVVRTASLAQVRQPIHNHSVEGWRRFESQLKPFIEALAVKKA